MNALLEKPFKPESQLKPKFKRRTRGLILTYQCNLNCIYCYIPEKYDKCMPFETAFHAVSGAFNEMPDFDFDEVEIDFAGAEPLTAFERLQAISEWIWRQPWPKPYILFATTNGTLLDAKMKEWFACNKTRIILGLSCDGNTRTQDRNRSGSSSSIDLDFFLNTWPKQPLKMTISEDTVADLADDIIYLHKKGFEITANPANGMKGWRQSNINEYVRQLAKLVEYYGSNPHIPRSTLLNVELKAITKKKGKFGNKHCGAGTAYDVVDIDGKVYPCHMFSPLVLPESKLKTLPEIDFSAREPFADPRCEPCILKNICPSCYGLNYKGGGNPARKEETLCRLFQIQALANCKYYLKLLESKNEITKDEYETATAIQAIYAYFNIIKPKGAMSHV
ncbi:MAG TPA: hypothetical protein VHY08_05250 [Bacillota bacterium]|nr:hypothetical protein [Bacillota bacterium]